MKIEYDAHKNEQNIHMRGLSFERVPYLDWDNALLWQDERHDYGESRNNALAIMEHEGRLYAVSFTVRGDVIRVISFRKANKRERKKYHDSKS